MARHNIQFENDELWAKAHKWAKARGWTMAKAAQHGLRLAIGGAELPVKTAESATLSDEDLIAEYEVLRQMKHRQVRPTDAQIAWLRANFDASWDEL